MKFTEEIGHAGLDFKDFGRMGVQKHAPAVSRRTDYGWALNDVTVRKVVAAHIAVMANARVIPETFDVLTTLDALAVSRLESNLSSHSRMAATAARRVGGLAAYFTSLIYRAIRLGDNSVQIAMDLGVTPWGIRQTLYRLNKTAQQLEAGTLPLCKPNMRYKRISGNRRGGGNFPRWDFQGSIQLRTAGATYAEIAAKWGLKQETVRSAFKKAGIIYPRARRSRPGGWKFNHLEAIALHADGASTRELAQRYGVDRETMWYAVNRSPAAIQNKKGRISPALTAADETSQKY